MNKDFLALDVETANADHSSICQIGLAKFRGGQVVDEWSSLVDPEDYFENTWIHGISEEDVVGSPKLPALAGQLLERMQDVVCVHYGPFDRIAINRDFEAYGLPTPDIAWLDVAKVARRTWKEWKGDGYRLPDVCEKIGYEFKHHDALEDAKAAGQVFLAAIEETGMDVDAWVVRVRQPVTRHKGSRKHAQKAIQREGDPEGALHGEVVVFTGALQISRTKAADLAAEVGCKVTPNVTKKTTLLVVGDQDLKKLRGRGKSSKQIKAEHYMQKGCPINIISESDFQELVDYPEEEIASAPPDKAHSPRGCRRLPGGGIAVDIDIGIPDIEPKVRTLDDLPEDCGDAKRLIREIDELSGEEGVEKFHAACCELRAAGADADLLLSVLMNPDYPVWKWVKRQTGTKDEVENTAWLWGMTLVDDAEVEQERRLLENAMNSFSAFERDER